MFNTTFWDTETLKHMRASHMSLDFWRPVLEWIAPSISVGMVAAFGVLVWAGLKCERCFKMLLALVAGQSILIVLLLPPEFRFLGGLQYAVLVLAGWAFWSSRQGSRLIARSWIVLIVFCMPWLAVQMYYSIPFLKVVTGILTRDDFLDRYVAFSRDFRVLDRILPTEAVLYVEGSRIPGYYAPRPVIFRLEDLRGRSPVYRFAVDQASRPGDRILSCTGAVYENQDAVTVTYRTPGREPVRQTLRVERCSVGAAE